jgi:hypothetical protein
MQTTWLKRFDNFCNVNAHTFVVGLQADTPVENRAVHALPNEVRRAGYVSYGYFRNLAISLYLKYIIRCNI